jgi:Zn-dependent protease
MAWFVFIGIFGLIYAIVGRSIEHGFIMMAIMVFVYCFVVVHEYGHALTAKYFGRDCEHITLVPFAGVASIDVPHNQPRQEFWITLNGPLTNLFWVGVTAPFVFQPIGAPTIDYILGLTFIINVWLLIFNFIPVFPMDGGRIFRALLQLIFGVHPLKATRITYKVGWVAAIIAAIGFLYLGHIFASIILLFVAYLGKQELERIEMLYAGRGNRPDPYFDPGARELQNRADQVMDEIDEVLRRNR